MDVREINNKEVWEGFLEQCEDKTFLSSWNWADFQKKSALIDCGEGVTNGEGNKIWRLGVYDNNQLVAVALVVKIKAKRGTFLFVPHGSNLETKFPIWKLSFQILAKELKKIAEQEKASFIRIAPIWARNEENIKIFKNLGFIDAPIHIHPEITWELDLFSNEKEILMKMRKTTRYLIRQAEKNKDIEIIQSQDIKDLELFNRVYQETVKRHQFVPFSLSYLQNQFLSFLPDNQISIFLGKYKGEVVSSAIIIYWQGIGFYHHGASLVKYNKIPVSYLLQWEAIKEAKNRGCKFYNFWGIAPEGKKKHPWQGLTLFKTGFGGYKKEYVKTQDLPVKSNYWLTYFFEKLRKVKRGL